MNLTSIPFSFQQRKKLERLMLFAFSANLILWAKLASMHPVMFARACYGLACFGELLYISYIYMYVCMYIYLYIPIYIYVCVCVCVFWVKLASMHPVMLARACYGLACFGELLYIYICIYIGLRG